MRFLEGLGFKVLLGEHVFSNSLGFAASPTEKAADLMGMFGDPAIRAIICTQGGDGKAGQRQPALPGLAGDCQ